MMFSGLRRGSAFYVLHKEENPTLKIGQVQGVTTPRLRYSSYQPNQQMFGLNEQVVDVSVRYSDGNIENFNMLPSTNSIANFGDKGVVVAESREAMVAEIEGMKRTSQEIIDSVDYHKDVIEAVDKILLSINPPSAKEIAADERMVAMEKRIGGIEGSIDSIKDMLTSALNRSTSNYPSKNK